MKDYNNLEQIEYDLMKKLSYNYDQKISEQDEKIKKLEERLRKLEEVFLWTAHDLKL